MDIPWKKLATKILKWASSHPRPMPWKNTTDPYKIWLSEIILQQTQVVQGTPYYLAFIRRFPTVKQLACASEDEVLRLWQGLGYNSRARHLHHAARTIVDRYGGVFPNTFSEIRSLKGVGEYTAAAIASFAFGEATPVLDSNVIRVLSRLGGITDDPQKQSTRKKYHNILETMLAGADPAEFNQAMMNFGAMQCTPRTPDCKVCNLSAHCVAFASDSVDRFPPKKPKATRKERFFHYFLLADDKGLLLHQRTSSDIWQMLYELPLIETKSLKRPSARTINDLFTSLAVDTTMRPVRIGQVTQTLTHQNVHCIFYRVNFEHLKRRFPEGYRFERFKNLGTFALPKAIRSFLLDNSLLLLHIPHKTDV